jgi:hypothetical protein
MSTGSAMSNRRAPDRGQELLAGAQIGHSPITQRDGPGV